MGGLVLCDVMVLSELERGIRPLGFTVVQERLLQAARQWTGWLAERRRRPRRGLGRGLRRLPRAPRGPRGRTRERTAPGSAGGHLEKPQSGCEAHPRASHPYLLSSRYTPVLFVML
eukprot:1930462-Pyramimonas_sp.AAC.1